MWRQLSRNTDLLLYVGWLVGGRLQTDGKRVAIAGGHGDNASSFSDSSMNTSWTHVHATHGHEGGVGFEMLLAPLR